VEDVHSQSEHVAYVGPDEEPAEQVEVEEHQPHAKLAVQEEQV